MIGSVNHLDWGPDPAETGACSCAQGQPLSKSAPQLLFRGPHTAWMRKICRCYWHVFGEWKVWVPITAN